MYLVIDVGNSRVKAAVIENNTIIDKVIFQIKDFFISVTKLIKNYNKIDVIIVSSVGNLDKDAFKNFEKTFKIFYVTNEFNFPFKNLYATPSSLGIDRMILSAGAVLQFPNKNRLVIDAGTCVTYDFINDKNEYLGGAISPGIRLRYESLHNYTSKLPLLSLTEPENIVGNSTNESIHSGVINGLVLEMDGFINAYYNNYKNFIIILTGGDAEFLAKRLKNTIFANSNFLLESLYQIYQYNQND